MYNLQVDNPTTLTDSSLSVTLEYILSTYCRSLRLFRTWLRLLSPHILYSTYSTHCLFTFLSCSQSVNYNRTSHLQLSPCWATKYILAVCRVQSQVLAIIIHGSNIIFAWFHQSSCFIAKPIRPGCLGPHEHNRRSIRAGCPRERHVRSRRQRCNWHKWYRSWRWRLTAVISIPRSRPTPTMGWSRAILHLEPQPGAQVHPELQLQGNSHQAQIIVILLPGHDTLPVERCAPGRLISTRSSVPYNS
jgi:hypothetical protein